MIAVEDCHPPRDGVGGVLDAGREAGPRAPARASLRLEQRFRTSMVEGPKILHRHSIQEDSQDTNHKYTLPSRTYPRGTRHYPHIGVHEAYFARNRLILIPGVFRGDYRRDCQAIFAVQQ